MARRPSARPGALTSRGARVRAAESAGCSDERHGGGGEHRHHGDDLVPDPPARQRRATSAVPAMPRPAHCERQAQLRVADDDERQQDAAKPACAISMPVAEAERDEHRRARSPPPPRSARRARSWMPPIRSEESRASDVDPRGDLGQPAGAQQHVVRHAERAVAGERPDDDVQHPVPDALEARGGEGLEHRPTRTETGGLPCRRTGPCCGRSRGVASTRRSAAS